MAGKPGANAGPRAPLRNIGAERRGKAPKKPGRPKGVPNKTTQQLKDMIMESLERLGGVKYLVQQGKDNPRAYLGLLSKVMPYQVNIRQPGSHPLTSIQLGMTPEQAAEMWALTLQKANTEPGALPPALPAGTEEQPKGRTFENGE